MSHDDLITLIDSIETDNKAVVEALAFIRLVVKNNPKKNAEQILARPDIQEALGVIDGWLKAAREAVEAVAAELPAEAATAATDAAVETLDKLEADTRIADRIGEWRATDEPPENWAAKIVLRMQWFIDWLRAMAEWIALGAPYKRWVSRLDERTCKFCRGLHGVVLPVGASFATEAAKAGFTRIYGGLFAPPLHPNCFPSGTPVAALGVTGVTERVFVGELVTLSVAGQQDLTVTPNHPVLTDRGWVAAGCLHEGDYAVGTGGQEWEVGAHENGDDVPALIEEVADTLLGSGLMPSLEVPVSAVDFHGDGLDGDVAVVGADLRLLIDVDSALPQPGREDLLGATDVMAAVRLRPSYGLSVFRRLLASTDGIMGSLTESLAFLRRSVLHPDGHGGAAPSGLNVLLNQDAADDASADGKAFSQGLLTFSSEIGLHEIVKVRRYPWSGHVFNLETADGWYIANGVIVHNCRCRLEPVSRAGYSALRKAS